MRRRIAAATILGLGAAIALWGTAGAATPRQSAGTPAPAVATPAAAVGTPVVSAGAIAAAASLAGQLNCPLCQGYTLRDCPLVVCAQMRELIVQKLAAGESQDAIVAYFVEQYGPQVLNQPLTSGFQLAAWLVPVAVLVVGFALAVGVVRRNSRFGAQPGQAAANPIVSAPDPGAADRAQQLESMLGERR